MVQYLTKLYQYTEKSLFYFFFRVVMFRATPLRRIQISLYPLHKDGRRKNQVHLQVLSTSLALPCRKNCLNFLNAAAQKTASHTLLMHYLRTNLYFYVWVQRKMFTYPERMNIFLCYECLLVVSICLTSEI